MAFEELLTLNRILTSLVFGIGLCEFYYSKLS